MHNIFRATILEYGVPPTVEGMREFDRATAPPRPMTRQRYLAICERLADRCCVMFAASGLRRWNDPADRTAFEFARVDRRLVAAGRNHESPRQWIYEGGLQRFLDYWEAAAVRADPVGSSYNTHSPAAAYAAMRQGIPPFVVQHLEQWRVFSGEHPFSTRRASRRRLRLLIDAARAAARTSFSRLSEVQKEKFATKALAALGRLCPELQRVAIDALERDPRWSPRDRSTDDWGAYWDDTRFKVRRIRVRDIPWDVVAHVQSQLAADKTGRVRIAWAAGRRQLALFEEIHPPATHDTDATERLRPPPPTLAQFLAPSYPRVSDQQAIRLARGETPVQLGDRLLTKREAHEWLASQPDADPVAWFCDRYLPAGTPRLRSIAVARWLLDVHRRGSWEALTRHRDILGPHGQRITVRYLDRVDEIMDNDLVRGPATGVEAAFECAARRTGEAWLKEQRGDRRVLQHMPPGWRLYRCMRHLCTPADLVSEGEELQHCVGTYVPAVESGKSVILSIRVLGHRSTVELTRDGRVLQHRGHQNCDPHPLCARVLERFLRRIRAY